MQIIAELDNQYVEKLQTLKKTTSELIALGIDDIFTKNTSKTEGQHAYRLMQQSGFIGCVENDENLSENYKSYLDWGNKT
ncbi:MAG: hypothetical protein ACNA7G_07130 [Methylobacter sp.]